MNESNNNQSKNNQVKIRIVSHDPKAMSEQRNDQKLTFPQSKDILDPIDPVRKPMQDTRTGDLRRSEQELSSEQTPEKHLPQEQPSRQSLLEQARERMSVLHTPISEISRSSHLAEQPALYPPDWKGRGNIQTRRLGLTKRGQKGIAASVLGVCVGLLLGFAAYYLFIGSSVLAPLGKVDNRVASGGAIANRSGQGQASNAVAASAQSVSSRSVLGPGGAAGPGTTVYLYQIGIYQDGKAADQVVNKMKAKGIAVLKRGNDPFQLVIGGAAQKSGSADLNDFLQQNGISYYMKPFVVPKVPSTVPQISDSQAQQLQQSLLKEWKFVEQISGGGQAADVSGIEKEVQSSLAFLPAANTLAKQSLQTSLQDLQHVADSITQKSQSNGAGTVAASYWLAKFYTDFAQGVADL